ncbi:MAG: CinA family protein [Brevundimonas sp.]
MTETLSAALPADVEALVEAVLKAADAQGVTLATAESCTGGLIASTLTDVEGRSHVFERGYVVYTNAAKTEEIAVPQPLIEQHGAVSRPVARAMAEGALRASGAGAAVAVTGFAGVAGPEDEPGLVHFAVAATGAETVHEEHHFGDVGRGPCRIACLRVALEMLQTAIIR